MYKDPRLKNEHVAWLHIFDFSHPPKTITDKLNLQPTMTSIKGQTRTVGKTKPRKVINQYNSWTLKSELSRSSSIEKHIEFILEVLRPRKDVIIELTKHYKIQFNCAVYYYEANPGISLEKGIIKEIAELNLPLYFDIYCLAGTVKELEDIEVKDDLIKQLSKVKLISGLSDKENDEPRNLVESLEGIESSTDKIRSTYLPDLFIEGEMPEEYYQAILENIASELIILSKYVKKSRYLQKQIDIK